MNTTEREAPDQVLEVVFTRAHGSVGVEYFTGDAEYTAWLNTGWRRSDVNLTIERALDVHVGFAVRPLDARVALVRKSRLTSPKAR